jgi:3-methylcrotonyl-CoA carboxylase alpha subunit
MSSIKRILIANRGEIASRIIRSCKKLGIESVAVYSEADRQARFVAEADLAYCIGDPAPSESYLNIEKILDVARKTESDAIHPGYGFLSENADFAQACQDADLIFIGPKPEQIRAMGSKSEAKVLMRKAGVSVVPGYDGADQADHVLLAEGKKIGFPLLIKASAGGGGKGMRTVSAEKDFAKALEAARRESQNAFGDSHLILEKFVEKGRHIEFQIFGDQHGELIHLYERECSVQRRYQKIIEESPSPFLSAEMREKMAEQALLAGKALNYQNAGTVEFIFDEDQNDFYFLEMNTRLQVEHPVTESVCDMDLVELQIRVAEGASLANYQEKIVPRGYAMECRIYAEDPDQDFLPQAGKIEHFEIPVLDGVRVDSALYSKADVSTYYDPMVAKLIVSAASRGEALKKMHYVLRQTQFWGIKSNISYLARLLEQEEIIEAKYHVKLLDDPEFKQKVGARSADQETLSLISAHLADWRIRQNKRGVLSALPSGWRSNFYEFQKQNFQIDDRELELKYRYLDTHDAENHSFQIQLGEDVSEVLLLEADDAFVRFEYESAQYKVSTLIEGDEIFVHHPSIGSVRLRKVDPFPEIEGEKDQGAYIAPMPAQIIEVKVSAGDKVEAGDVLVVFSSMKMETAVEAHSAGTIKSVFVNTGDQVQAGQQLLEVDSENNSEDE